MKNSSNPKPTIPGANAIVALAISGARRSALPNDRSRAPGLATASDTAVAANAMYAIDRVARPTLRR